METPQPQFLSNGPVGKDLFEGRSQEKTADTLCDILKRNDFQIIGIDGGWGTGKSNLVSIIEARLKTQNFNFFIYDVWGHQEDEQRRAILEELTEKICDENILSNKNKWQKKLEKILAKEREVTTINRPYLGIGVVFTLFSIIYVPSVTIFAKDLPATFTKWGMGATFWKLLIVGFPLILVLITFIWHFVEQLFSQKQKLRSFKIASQKTFQVYNNKQIDETKIETISENEPTVKDFRKWMNEIDTDLNGKKLVLVFDNFDRLPKKHILSLWSSIHVFFAEEKYQNIKVIIPFDRQHIQNAFKDIDYKKEDVTSGVKKTKNNYSEDYINKTFDIVYRVSPPILSNWKNYFKEKWNEAFGKGESDEYEKVVQLYEIFNDTITPREVIVFINEIVSLKLLFNSQIPENYFALFLLNKDVLLIDPLKEISEPSYLSGASYLYKNDDNLAKYMTAIIYQINPDNAIEIVYTKQLKNAMVNKDFETFRTISNSPFFHNTIHRVLSEIGNIEFPIETLDSLDENIKLSVHSMKLVWKKLYDKAIDYSFDEFELKPFQKILLKNIEPEKALLWLKDILERLYPNKNFDAILFAGIIDNLHTYIDSNKIELDVFDALKQKEVSVNSFIPFIANKLEKFIGYKLSCNESELNEYLNNLSIDQLGLSPYIKFLKIEYSLKEFQENLENLIQQNATDKGRLKILYARLKEVSDRPLKVLLNDSQIYSLFNSSTTSEHFYYDILAMRLSRLNEFNSSYAGVFATILNSEDEDVIEKVAQRIQHFIDYDDFLIGSSQLKDSTLYKLVCKKIIENNYGDSTVKLRSLLLEFEKIVINTGVDAKAFLQDLDNWIYDKPNDKDPVELPNLLYASSIEIKNTISTSLINGAIDYFNKFTKEEWVNIFDNLSSKLFELVKIISFNKWNSYSKAALTESLEKLLVGKKLKNKGEWQYIFKSFQSQQISLNNVFKSIRDKVYKDRELINKEFFSFLIDYFMQNNILQENPGEAFRTFFKNEFLDDSELVSQMTQWSNSIGVLIRSSKEDDIADFVQGLRDRNENSFIQEFANNIGINLSTSKKK
jgi:hypothetical protein